MAVRTSGSCMRRNAVEECSKRRDHTYIGRSENSRIFPTGVSLTSSFDDFERLVDFNTLNNIIISDQCSGRGYE